MKLEHFGKIAIIGAPGLLGTELVKQGATLGLPIIRAGYSTKDLKNYALVDITQPESLNFFLDTWSPDIIINCAAYTQVDAAEDNYDSAMRLNAVAVENLAKVCLERKIFLLHVSTDYVFGGDRTTREIAYKENENCSPCGIYGWSKYFGERAVLTNLPGSSLVLRTSWLHGLTGPNFIKSILKAASERPELKVVNDQAGSLTFAPWLAEVIYELLKKRVTGILHACARDTTTWFDVAQKVLLATGSNCNLVPQTTEESQRRAPRPNFSKLDTSALNSILKEPVPSNQDFIELYLKQAFNE